MKRGKIFTVGSLAVACAALLTFAACGQGEENPGDQTQTPVITASVDEAQITAGEQITLT